MSSPVTDRGFAPILNGPKFLFLYDSGLLLHFLLSSPAMPGCQHVVDQVLQGSYFLLLVGRETLLVASHHVHSVMDSENQVTRTVCKTKTLGFSIRTLKQLFHHFPVSSRLVARDYTAEVSENLKPIWTQDRTPLDDLGQIILIYWSSVSPSGNGDTNSYTSTVIVRFKNDKVREEQACTEGRQL